MGDRLAKRLVGDVPQHEGDLGGNGSQDGNGSRRPSLRRAIDRLERADAEPQLACVNPAFL
jgi:hypothetical protein